MDASGHVLAVGIQVAVKNDSVGHTVKIETEDWR
jgi:hypothetical protein